MSSWNTEDDEPRKPKAGFEVKAYLVLVDSDKEEWGIIEDTMNNILWQPGMGEIVGTWSRPKYDNLIHISLSTPLSALQDRSIQTFAHYAEERRQQKLGVKKPPKRTRKAAEPTQEQALSLPALGVLLDSKLEFNALRAKLGKPK